MPLPSTLRRGKKAKKENCPEDDRTPRQPFQPKRLQLNRCLPMIRRVLSFKNSPNFILEQCSMTQMLSSRALAANDRSITKRVNTQDKVTPVPCCAITSLKSTYKAISHFRQRSPAYPNSFEYVVDCTAKAAGSSCRALETLSHSTRKNRRRQDLQSLSSSQEHFPPSWVLFLRSAAGNMSRLTAPRSA